MPTLNNDIAEHYLQTFYNDSQIVKVERIQSLWSAYGEIARYLIPSLSKSVIVKLVSPPANTEHPRGWDGEVSHQRKLDSYINESIFYQQYSQHTNHFCRTPACYFSSNSDASFIKAGKDASFLIMEDLDQAGFYKRCDEPSLKTIKLGVRWLAFFHAQFLSQPLPNVWPVGTYWHLKTRPNEFNNMPNSELKRKAHTIDEVLNNAKYQTLLHGDAKLANFCFNADENDLAAVDFQYVGQGAGVKDLMYFMGSCLDDAGLHMHANDIVDEYFAKLREATQLYSVDANTSSAHKNKLNLDALENEWRELLPFAWADFERFLVGWASEHYKLNGFMSENTRNALAKLPPVLQ
jgi:hypothetical protein